jgi:hypothetical protein
MVSGNLIRINKKIKYEPNLRKRRFNINSFESETSCSNEARFVGVLKDPIKLASFIQIIKKDNKKRTTKRNYGDVVKDIYVISSI